MKIYTGIKIFSAAIIVSALIAGIASCKKNSNSTASTTVTEADAAQLTLDAVSPASGGMANQLSASTEIYSSVALACGVQKDSVITIASVSGAIPSYSYIFDWTYKLNCTQNVPASVNFGYTAKGTYDGSLMSDADTANAQFVLTGTTSAFMLTVNYTRDGVVTSKIGRHYLFQGTLNIQSSNIAIDKTSHEISSGTANVTFVATATSGKKFTFSGILTFLGSKQATLVLNSGVSYPLHWN